ncbi:MAG: hypothetical protein IJ615_04915 [Bacteroidaceae bacterium]|nr:hypothetical protein [Bacteroidaceae bacterium]
MREALAQGEVNNGYGTWEALAQGEVNNGYDVRQHGNICGMDADSPVFPIMIASEKCVLQV